MIKILELKNIKLASINKKYGGVNKHTGRMFVSKDYIATQEMLYLSLRKVRIDSPIQLDIYLESYKDIDNIIHNIVNSIQKKGIIKNDRDINHLRVYKKPLKRGSLDSLHVFIKTSELDYNKQFELL